MLKENSFLKSKYRKLFYGGVAGWLVSILSETSDEIFSGLFIDDKAVSAVSLISPLLDIAYFLALMIACGCAVAYSKHIGEDKKEDAHKIAGMGLLCAIILSIILGLVLFIFKNNILEFYDVGEDIYIYADAYYTPLSLLCVSYPIVWFIYNLVLYDGDERNIFIFDVPVSILKIVVSFFLVKYMGIAGLAYSTLISYAVGLIVLLTHLFKKSNTLKFKLSFNFKELISMFKTSYAMCASTLYLALVDIVFNYFIINFFGEDYLPIYVVMSSLAEYGSVINSSIDAGSPFISLSLGEDNPYSIRRTMNVVNRYSLWSGIIVSIILFMLAPIMPDVFGVDDPVLYTQVVYASRIVPAFFVFSGFLNVYVNYYSIIEEDHISNILSFNSTVVGPLLLSIGSSLIFGLNGLIWGYSLIYLFGLIVTYIYIKFIRKEKSIYLLEDTNEIESHYDFIFTKDCIVEVRDKIEEFLIKNNTNKLIINKVLLWFEDSSIYIMNHNDNKIIGEVSILISSNKIRLFIKDTGKIFDLTQDEKDSKNLRAYVLDSLSLKSNGFNYSTALSFNRNECEFNL